MDWLVTKVLNQLVEFVPSHIKNTEQIINVIKRADPKTLSRDCTFISLDIVNLYPSIPIQFGLDIVIRFAEANWQKIDSFGLKVEDLKKCLTFIAFNYEICFDDKTFLQIKGCPMGSHFSPPFAVIVVNHIEVESLKILRSHGINAPVYGRFIDDIVMGPFDRCTDFDLILNSFNSINDSIQFTMEVPSPGSPLNFLDISISVNNCNISYTWYNKECHSGITLSNDSWVPNHVKSNFIRSSEQRVKDRCSSIVEEKPAMSSLHKRLLNNGYRANQLNKTRTRIRNQDHNKLVNLNLNFVSDKCNRKINKIIKKYNFPIRLVCKPGPTLNQCLKKKRKTIKHSDCEVCRGLDDRYSCEDKCVVYKFTCTHCSLFYIGLSSRPFYLRYQEHKRSISLKNDNSALSQHSKEVHGLINMTIADFNIHILDKLNSPLETRLREAHFIQLLKPQLNRKMELTQF